MERDLNFETCFGVVKINTEAKSLARQAACRRLLCGVTAHVLLLLEGFFNHLLTKQLGLNVSALTDEGSVC